MVWAKIKSRFQQGGTVRDVATLTIGTALAQGIAIAVTPLLTRLYTPSDFGLLAVFLAVSSVGATFVTLRYESSILVPKENGESANLVLLSLLLGLGLSVVLGLLGVLIPADLQEKIGLGILGNWLPIAFFSAAFLSALAIMQGWFNRQKKYQHMALLRIGQSTIAAGLAVLLGFLSTSNGLLIAQIVSSFCICLLALWFGRSATYLWKQQHLRQTAFLHKNTPKYLLPTALLDVVTLQLPVLLISAWFGAEEAGQFSMAWRLLMIPMALIGGAVGQVFLQKFAKNKHDPQQSRVLLMRTWRHLFFLGVVPLGFVMFFGDDLFLIFLGDKWVDSGAIAMILAPMALAMLISSPTSGTFIIIGIQKYSLYFGLASLIYRPASLAIGYYFESIHLGLFIFVIFELIQIFFYQLVAWKNINKAHS
jgi:O-antigen/teichoic acid export membrane protein